MYWSETLLGIHEGDEQVRDEVVMVMVMILIDGSKTRSPPLYSKARYMKYLVHIVSVTIRFDSLEFDCQTMCVNSSNCETI